MKNQEIKALSLEELRDKLKEARVGLRKMQFAHALSNLESPMKLRYMRRFIARLKTQEHTLKSQSKA